MSHISIGIADDHKLFRKGMIALLETFHDLKIIWDAENGLELLEKAKTELPDIILIDINMPKKNGIETTRELKELYPGCNIIALSMYDDESNIITMLEQGANGYLLKDSDPDEIYTAIRSVLEKGIYYSTHVTKILTNSLIHRSSLNADHALLNENEIAYLKLVCKEYTNKEIAGIMNISDRTADGYRDRLLEKLKVKNRIGLALYAYKHGIADV